MHAVYISCKHPLLLFGRIWSAQNVADRTWGRPPALALHLKPMATDAALHCTHVHCSHFSSTRHTHHRKYLDLQLSSSD